MAQICTSVSWPMPTLQDETDAQLASQSLNKLKFPSNFKCVKGANCDVESILSIVQFIALASLPFILTYLYTLVESISAQTSKKIGKKAPLVPYAVPIVGHALMFVWSLNSLIKKNAQRFNTEYNRYVPVRFQGIFTELCFVSGPKNVAAMFRCSRNFSAKATVVIAMDRLFGTPKHIVPFYDYDNTGVDALPHPNANKVEPHHRLHHIVHIQVIKYLSGSGLKPMSMRFMENVGKQINHSGIGSEWLEISDLFEFCQLKLLHASIDAMFGPYLTALNPDFVSDFWKFDKCTSYLLKGLPRFMVPGSWAARGKCLQSLKRYNEYASRLHEADGNKDYKGVDPFFGTEFIRQRNEAFSKMAPMNADAIASEHLAIMWAANSNSIPAAFWFLYEIFRDPILLPRVRKEVDSARLPSSDPNEPPRFDLDMLGKAPLLQSIYAEVLRLHAAILVTRMPERNDFRLGDWIYPKNKLIIVASHTAHHDESVWNTGTVTDPHPLDEFWAERFLIYPNDPNSGPLKNAKAQRARPAHANLLSLPNVVESEKEEGPKFSTDGLAGAWIPYGGGQTLCPGRHYAKQEMLVTFAVLAISFDVEILQEKGETTETNLEYFGLGVLPPKGKTPIRIRRRRDLLAATKHYQDNIIG